MKKKKDVDNSKMFNYITIQGEIIENQDLPVYRVMVYTYMQCFRKGNEVKISVEDICKWGGFTPDYKKGRINSKIFDILEKMSNQNYFTSTKVDELEVDFKTVSRGKKSSATLYTLELNPEKFNFFGKNSSNGGYAIIWTDEINKIRNFKEYIAACENDTFDIFNIELYDIFSDIQNIHPKIDLSNSTVNTISGKGKPVANVPKLLLLLSYIRLHTHKTKESDRKKGNYVPECYFSFLNTISKKIGLSTEIVSNSLKSLWMMRIILTKEMTRDMVYLKSKGFVPHTRPAIMANVRRIVKNKKGYHVIDNTYDCDDEINRQIDILEGGKYWKG